MRLLDLSRHCRIRRAVREDGRAGRRRERHARPGVRADGNITVGMPGQDEQGSGWAAGEIAEHDAEFTGQ